MSRISLNFISEDYTNASSSTYLYSCYTVSGVSGEEGKIFPWYITYNNTIKSGTFAEGGHTTTVNLGNIHGLAGNTIPRPNDLLNPVASYSFTTSHLNVLIGQYQYLKAEISKPSNTSADNVIYTYHIFVESKSSNLRLLSPVYANTFSLDKNSNVSAYTNTALYVYGDDTVQIYDDKIKIYYTNEVANITNTQLMYVTLLDNSIHTTAANYMYIMVDMQTPGTIYSFDALFDSTATFNSAGHLMKLHTGSNIVFIKLDTTTKNWCAVTVDDSTSAVPPKTINIIFDKIKITEPTSTYVKLTSNDITFGQNEEIVGTDYKTRPTITTETRYAYVDNVNCDNARCNNPIEYTNRSIIHTNVGDKYYGIRTVRDVSTGKILDRNIPGQVVRLEPITTQQHTISFENDETYMLVDPKWYDFELIGDYRFSYEYSNENVQYGNYGVRYYGGRAIKGFVEASSKETATYFTVDYKTKGTHTYIPLPVTSPYSNINSAINVSEYLYTGITVSDANDEILAGRFPKLWEWTDVYKYYVSYHSIPSTYVTGSAIKANPTKYYKRIGNTYIPYNAANLQDNENVNDTYCRYITYTKLSAQILSEPNINFVRQEFDYTIIDNTYIQGVDPEKYIADTNVVYLKYKNSEDPLQDVVPAYMPQQLGIVTDGSIQYYGLTYVKLSNEELNDIKTNSTNTKVYIKHQYRKISPEEFAAYHYTKPLYTRIAKVGKTSLSPTTLLSDINITGNVVYGSDASNALNKDEIISKTTNKTSQSATARPKLYDFGLNEFANNVTSNITLTDDTGKYKATSDTNSIKYSFNYDGIYEQVNVTTRTEFKSSEPFYIKGESYVEIPTSMISVNSNVEYYAWRIAPISASRVKKLPVTPGIGQIYGFTGIILPTYIGVDGLHIAPVNENGFFAVSDAEYYTRTPKYKDSDDLHFDPNEEYFTYNEPTFTYTSDKIAFTNLTEGHPDVTFDDEKIPIWSTTKYYKEATTSYTLTYAVDTYTANDNSTYYTYHPFYTLQDAKNGNDCVFLYSKYLYNTYTINSGVQIESNGKYYTDIYVFDGTQGATSQRKYLNRITHTITNYTYQLEQKNNVIIESEYQVHDVPTSRYNEYTIKQIKKDDGTILYEKSVDKTSLSPREWMIVIKNNSNPLYTYTLSTVTTTTRTSRYDGSQNAGSYQYIDSVTLEPKVFLVDDMMLGIIFKTSNNYLKQNQQHKGTISEFNYKYTVDNVEYNNVEFEPVELYTITTNNNGLQIQEGKNIKADITKPSPLSLKNDVELDFKDTYTWHNPERSYYLAFDGSTYAFKEVETVSGYWTHDYEKNDVPFKIAAYQFYTNTDDITSTTRTYSFVPYSYIKTATIEHPQITYTSLVSQFEEYIYYTYMYDGKEYQYGLNDLVQDNHDGTYTGLAFGENAPDIDNFPSRPVSLIKHIKVEQNVKTQDIVEQEKSTSYEYFAYKTSIALTNEKVPLLYAVELEPAHAHDVLVWDGENQTYTIQNVLDSYAYYSYKYMYDTIPFQVSSYLFQASYFTVDNFDDLGAYIGHGMTYVKEILDAQNNVLNNGFATVSGLINAATDKYEIIASYSNAYMQNLTNTMNSAIDNAKQTMHTDIDAMSNALVNIITASYVSTYGALAYHMQSMVESFTYLQTEYANQETASRNQSTYNTNYLRDTIHADVIGGGIDIPKSLYSYTDANGYISYISVEHGQHLGSIADVIAKAFMNTYATSVSYTNPLTYATYTSIQYSYSGLADIFDDLHISWRIPTKQEFMLDVSKKMYTNCDFINEVVDDVKYDSDGNVISKSSHKNQPVDIAKKSIYWANVLWTELVKAGVVPEAGSTNNSVTANGFMLAQSNNPNKAKKNAATIAMNKLLN